MSRARVTLWLATLVIALTAAPPPASAATILVDCDVADLRAKMATALANDVLRLQNGCTYLLTGAANDDVNASGDLDFIGGVVTPLTIQGMGAILDGGNLDRVIDVADPGRVLTITDVTIRNGDATQNTVAKQGGGIFVGTGSTVNLANVTLTGNKGSQGGAIFNQGTVVANNVTMNGNTADTGVPGEGGGLWNATMSAATLTNSTISGNTAFADGGGIFDNGGAVTLVNVTLAGNTAVSNGGVSGTVTAKNTIFAGNTAGGPSNCDTVVSQGNNLVQDATNCTGLGGSDIVGQDPLLGPLQNNGGKTATHAVASGPALDAGTATGAPLTDQRGRPRPSGAGIDIGAFEFAPPSFGDVPTSFFAFQFVEDLFASGVTSGCSTGTPPNYCPNDPVTRGQMAVFIIRAAEGVDPVPPGAATFTDVPTTHPFFAFIERMAALGITTGCGPGLYCPDAPVTREQMSAFMIRALGEFAPPAPASQRFGDVPPSNPFYPFIDRMAVFNITAGCGGGNYCPTDPVTRGQMAVFLVRAFSLPLFEP
jgi:hypothetical protein